MSEEQKPKRTVEWSFSFEQVGESLNKALAKLSGDEEIKTAQYSAPQGGASGAHIRLGLSVGQVNVSALSGSDNLIEADVKYTGEMEFTVTGETEKTVYLGQKTPPVAVVGPLKDVIGKFANREELRWDVRLSPHLPLDLDIDGGVGPSTLDLTGLRLTKLDMQGGVGESRIVLPSHPTHYTADIRGGVGSVTVAVPDGAALRLKVQGGVGGVTLDLPENAAVRIEVEGGLGGSSVPERFARVKGGESYGIGGSGVWETPGFALATQQIQVEYKGGIGGLTVR